MVGYLATGVNDHLKSKLAQQININSELTSGDEEDSVVFGTMNSGVTSQHSRDKSVSQLLGK